MNFKKLDTPSLIKWAILAVLAAFSCYVTFPVKEKVRLGLDLQGGTSFTVGIDEVALRNDKFDTELARMRIPEDQLTPEQRAEVQKAADAEANKILAEADDLTLEVLRKRIDNLGTNEPMLARIGEHRFLVQIPGATPEQTDAAERSVKSAAFLEFRLVSNKSDSLSGAAMANKNRTPVGFERSTLREGGLCFVRADNYDALSEEPNFKRRLGSFGAQGDASVECVMEEVGKDINGKAAYRPMYVERRNRNNTIAGSTVSKAFASRSTTTGGYEVNLSFNSEGTEVFGTLTSANVGRRFAIILDDVVRSAPRINDAITSGSASITGNFTPEEVQALSGVLNAGALNAPIRILEKRQVSASLGDEAITKGTSSAIAGVVAVFVFMLVYYLFCGVIADIALLLNMVLWPAGMIIASGLMSVFLNDGTGSTGLGQLPVLTLPGIAGLVLSIGMAVDANVLIFERMREEFRLGKTTKSAVAAGYDRAFLAIFDSNLTTLITGVVLFIFGSGPIRGFAVTLCGGIIISMFTALVITRLIFNITVSDTTKPFKMLSILPADINIDFLKWAPHVTFTALAVIVVTLSIFFTRAVKNPASVMAVDFTGGVAINYEAIDKASGEAVALDVEKVRSVIADISEITDQTVQATTAEGGKPQMLIKTSTVTFERDGQTLESSRVIESALDEAFPDQKVTLVSEDRVGSQIGSELKKDATWAIVISLICIIIYVGFRFEFGFALGGVLALAHDALITLGIYTICGSQVSLTTVAALLTIVGYSINNTIVVFDRVREMLARDTTSSFYEVIRRALNQTLSRSILTTLTTLLPIFALYFFGGAAMHDFAFALFIGLLIGIYSSLFVVPWLVMLWYKGKRPATRDSKNH